MKALRVIRGLMAFLTAIPLRMDESFLEISARFMFLFPVIGVIIGFLAGIYSFFTNNVLSLLFASLNATLFSGSQKLFFEFIAQGLASAMTLAFLLVLIGLQHTDGLVDVGNALGIRKASLKEKVEIAHVWTVTRTGAFLALLVSFFTLLFIFFTKTMLTIMNKTYIKSCFDLEDECGKAAYDPKKKTMKELNDFIKGLHEKYP